MDKKASLKSIIQLFESGHASLPTTLNSINELTGREIDEYEILSYSSYTSLDNLCEALLTDPITTWKKIGAGSLIEEILNNKTNYTILFRNSEALGKIHNKTTGQVKEIIYPLLFSDEWTILQKLNVGAVILGS